MSREIIFYGKPLRFSSCNHRYYWGGEYVPSVTTILGRLAKPMLIQWAANCAVDHIERALANGSEDMGFICQEARAAHATIRDAAGDVGTMVHEIARRILLGEQGWWISGHLSEQVQQALKAFESWRDQHTIVPVALERRIFSAEMLYAGTCDFFGRIDGDLSVLDFKTGNGVYDEAWYQLSGYERALIEELPATPPLTHWIVHLSKTTGECRTYRREPDETVSARRVWSHLVAMDRAIREMPKMEKAA